jgi:hypothetical protein
MCFSLSLREAIYPVAEASLHRSGCVAKRVPQKEKMGPRENPGREGKSGTGAVFHGYRKSLPSPTSQAETPQAQQPVTQQERNTAQALRTTMAA